MKDGELDPMYVQKREQLKQVVADIIRPKIVQGKTLSGKEFVSFLEQVFPFNFKLCILGMIKLSKLVIMSMSWVCLVYSNRLLSLTSG